MLFKCTSLSHLYAFNLWFCVELFRMSNRNADYTLRAGAGRFTGVIKECKCSTLWPRACWDLKTLLGSLSVLVRGISAFIFVKLCNGVMVQVRAGAVWGNAGKVYVYVTPPWQVHGEVYGLVKHDLSFLISVYVAPVCLILDTGYVAYVCFMKLQWIWATVMSMAQI